MHPLVAAADQESATTGPTPRRRHSRSPTQAGRSCRAASRTRPSPPIPAPRSLHRGHRRASRPAPSERPLSDPRCDTPPRTAPPDTRSLPTASTPATSPPSRVASTPSRTAPRRRGVPHHRSRPNATRTGHPPPPPRPPARRPAIHRGQVSSLGAGPLCGADERPIGHRPAAPSPPAARAQHNENDDDPSPDSVPQVANDGAFRRHLDGESQASRDDSQPSASVNVARHGPDPGSTQCKGELEYRRHAEKSV